MPGTASAALATSEVRFTVSLGAPGQANLSAIVLTDDAPGERGSTVLIVPGLAQTAQTLVDLATGLLRPDLGQRIPRVVMLDLPGHGGSGLPTAAPFGTLVIDDYVTAVLETLDHLQASGMSPDAMIGHSLGAEVVLLAQERLHGAGNVTEGALCRSRCGADVASAPVATSVGVRRLGGRGLGARRLRPLRSRARSGR